MVLQTCSEKPPETLVEYKNACLSCRVPAIEGFPFIYPYLKPLAHAQSKVCKQTSPSFLQDTVVPLNKELPETKVFNEIPALQTI